MTSPCRSSNATISCFLIATFLTLLAAAPLIARSHPTAAGATRSYTGVVLRRAAGLGGGSVGRAFFAANWAALASEGRILLSALSERSQANSQHYEVMVLLEYGDEQDVFEWRGTMAADEFAGADSQTRRLVKKYSAEALKALARQVGYFDSLHGNEQSSMPETRLLRVTATDLEQNLTKQLFPR